MMKLVLFDNTNRGILWASIDPLVCNDLRRGMLDSNLKHVYDWDELYPRVTKKDFLAEDWVVEKQGGVIRPMHAHEKNDFYLTRKKWATLRAPLITSLHRRLHEATIRSYSTIWPSFENNVADMLAACDPATEKWDSSLIEYAAINEVEPRVAYRELSLKNTGMRNSRMRAFAWAEKFLAEISEVRDEAAATIIAQKFTAKFSKDSNL